MAEDRHYWVLDRRVLEYVRFGEFHWWELLIIAGVLAALVGYGLFALFLDRRARSRARRRKQTARLQSWLEQWELEPYEEEALWELAESRRPHALFALLADPARFESTVHEALERGEHLPFAERIRETLGYLSSNLHIPIVSTRQIVVGDHFRLTVWDEGRPQHHYGMVTSVSAPGVTVELTEAGYAAVAPRAEEADLFYLRASDVEVRFPVRVRNRDAARHRLLLAHALVTRGQRARGTRLPMMRQVVVRLRTQLGESQQPVDSAAPSGRAALRAAALATEWPEGDPDPDRSAAAPAASAGEQLPGALLEMSEGGFSMVLLRQVAEGAYLDYEMPLPRGRTLPIMGRVLDCRPYTGTRWLVRCELRGLSPTQRNTLSQVLRLEQQRRLNAMREERRKLRRGELEP